MAERYRPNGDYASRTIAGETIVVPIRSNVADLESVYTFNEVAAAVWARLGGGASAEELAAAVAEEFEVSEETARADVGAFLRTLREEGMVTVE